MKTSEKLIVAFLAGSAAGALLGVLFAPAKGSDTRKKIRNDAVGVADQVNAIVNKGKQKLETMREHILHDLMNESPKGEVDL